MAGKKDKKRKKVSYKNVDSLKAGKNTKVRSEFIDYDYKDKLSKEELEYLAKFNNEFYGAAVGYNPETGRAKSGQLHKKRSQIKEIFDDNNRRNNDVLGVTKANILLSDIQAEVNTRDGWYITNSSLVEEAQNAGIDSQGSEEYLSFEEYQDIKANLTLEMQMFYEAYFAGDLEEP